MPLYVIGLNHRTAPIEVREKVAFANDEQRQALEAIRSAANADEAVLVSTCNRTEMYLRGDANVTEKAREWLAHDPRARGLDLGSHLYTLADADATRHVFRVAAGLDSMVLGEPQILGQVRFAAKLADEVGTLGGPLQRLMQDSFQVAKRVRTETEIGATSVSMAAAALKLAQQIFGEVSDIRVLLIGVGEMTQLAAAHFAAKNPAALVVANRTVSRARELAAQHSGSAMALEELPARLHEFDAIITSTSSSLPIIGKGMVEAAMKKRRHRPMFLVDLAVPRDIEPAVGSLEDVYLHTLDTLGRVVQQNMARRESAVTAAEAIIDTHTQAFMGWLAQRGSVPVIQQLRSRAEQYRQVELERAQKLLARGDDPQKVMEALANGLTNKFLHHPMAAIRQASPEQREQLADALERLYPNSPDSPDNVDGADAPSAAPSHRATTQD